MRLEASITAYSNCLNSNILGPATQSELGGLQAASMSPARPKVGLNSLPLSRVKDQCVSCMRWRFSQGRPSWPRTSYVILAYSRR